MEASTNADAQPPPPASGSHSTEDPQRFCEGLYILTNKQSRTVLDTWGPRSRVGSRCHGHAPTYSESIGNQLWTILQSKGSGKPYTMQNIRYQTFLELARDLENQVIGNPCLQTSEAQSAQEWILVELTPSLYTSGMVCCSAHSHDDFEFLRIQCAQTYTFLEIPDGNPANATPLACSIAAKSRDHQTWYLERVSRTTLEIKTSLKTWRPNLLAPLIQPHEDSAEYFALPRQLIRTIWETTKLGSLPLRRRMFDYDDFVIKSKDAVKSWARDRFPPEQDRYSILFGIIYGEAKTGPRAYNWYLTQDMRSLIFFDAQTGKEYTTEALDAFGFEPTFVML